MLHAEKQWEQRQQLANTLTDDEIEQLSESNGWSQALIRLANQRGYTDEEALAAYLSPAETFHSPFELYDMDRLVNRLQQAIAAREHILVYGDYDVDGITSTTILVEMIEALGGVVEYYLPDRFEDGYGPNKSVYQYFIKRGVDVILTCDNGVRGHEAIAYAQSEGVDVLVTDHHELDDTLPDAYAIVHPRHPKGNYPFGELCGAGVALKVATAMNEGNLPIEMLDLAAMGTIADVVSLTDENRYIVQRGIEQLQHTERIGLQLLLSENNIPLAEVDEETIGFIIAPRLNALGRMKQAMPGVELLMTFDDLEANEIIEEIETLNNERRAIGDAIAQNVDEQLQAMSELPPIIVLSGEDWHAGIVGIIAGRVSEKYHRPAILLDHDTDKHIYKGSGRAPEGISLYEILDQASDLAEAWGGHAAAAGMTIDEDDYDAWRQKVIASATAFESVIAQTPKQTYDMTLPITQVTIPFIESLQAMQPFGQDNTSPLFMLRDVTVQSVQRVGRDRNTLKLQVSDGENTLSLIGFRIGEKAFWLKFGNRIDVLVKLSINTWQGERNAQGQIIDIRSDEAEVYDLRRVSNRQSLFNVSNALYLFEQETHYERFRTEIPDDSQAKVLNTLVLTDLENDEFAAIDQIVIFDCLSDVEKLKAVIQTLNVKNIYVFAYSEQNSYLSESISKQDFGQLYVYIKKHGAIPLIGNEARLAKYFHWSVDKLKFMLKVLKEGQLIVYHAPNISIRKTAQSVDLMALPLMRKRRAQIDAERFFRYSDCETLKQALFDVSNDGGTE